MDAVVGRRSLGLCAGRLGRVRNYRPALSSGRIESPSDVLLDRYGKSQIKRAIDAVGPVTVIRIAIVRIEYGPPMIEEFERGAILGAQGSGGGHEGKERRIVREAPAFDRMAQNRLT